MEINFAATFYSILNEQIIYIARDKPLAAKKFKKDLIESLKKDLKYPTILKNLYILMTI